VPADVVEEVLVGSRVGAVDAAGQHRNRRTSGGQGTAMRGLVDPEGRPGDHAGTEAAVRSGALNTANWTDRLSRALMGVPGPVTSAPSQGVHQLLRAGSATLVTRGAEVAELVGAAGDHLTTDERTPERSRDRLRPREAQVLDAVPVARPARADSISRTAGIGLVEVQRLLGRLRDRGLVECGPAGWTLSDAAR
jgi:DNA processing protein